ncbi:MAG: TRAP transporter substrate-binding protein [Cyclobacteriaceae bacterium]|nr:TRAP transporter substrate-binding protein [Cyclobacteriaceae bacterium SS2]
MKYLPVLFLGLILIGCDAINKDTRVIKLAHGLDIEHPVHKGMEYMAEKVKENSGGKLQINIYPSGQLGQERELLELMQIGSIEITKVSAAALENFVPSYKVLGLPYIYRNQEHRFAVWDGPIGEKLLAEGADYLMRGLCFYDAGSRSFYTKDKPIKNPSDLNGMKIRVMNSVTAFDMVKALGASPTPISFGELYTALQQGIVDGAENNAPSFYTSHHYEVCKYYSIDEHSAQPDVLLINSSLWNDLSIQEKKWLKDAVDASVIEQRILWKESVEYCLEQVKAAGVEVIYPDKEPFQKKVDPLYEQFKDDPVISKLIQEIRDQK